MTEREQMLADIKALRETLEYMLETITDGNTVEPHGYITAIEKAHAVLRHTAHWEEA